MLLCSGTAGAQIIIRISGTDTAGHDGDGGVAFKASLRAPSSICRDAAGNIYIADGGPFGYKNDGRVRKITADSGIITTIAGLTNPADSAASFADNIPATNARLRGCAGICMDKEGNLLIADGNGSIRKVNLGTGMITTVAGNSLTTGYAGDNGPATAALLDGACDVAVDAANNIYVAEMNNHVIRKITATTGIIRTIAGRGALGFSGDGGQGTAAKLNQPRGILIDGSNNLYIADYNNNRVRVLNQGSGVITTYAGTGPGFGGDGGPAAAAKLNQPVRLAMDDQGNLYIADAANQRIRKVVTVTGTISTFAGNGAYFTGPDSMGDNRPAIYASIAPYGMCFDGCNNLYVGSVLCRLRAITPSKPTSGLLCGLKINAVNNLAPLDPQDLTIFPNPNYGAFTLQLSSAIAEKVQITVSDITGRIISVQSSVTNKETNVQLNTPSGMYFVTATTQNGKVSKKIVVE